MRAACEALQRCARVIAILTLATAALAGAAAAAPEMVRDINVTVPIRNSVPRYLGSTSTRTFFSAVGSFGDQIWRTDGTTAGTVPVAAAPAPMLTTPGIALGERLLLFFSSSPASPADLWSTDGTASGMQHLATEASLVGHTQTFVLFRRIIANGGSELWRSDGTSQGTFLLSVQPPGDPFPIGRGDIAVAAKTHLVGPRELIWVSDGTADGTREAPIVGSVAPSRMITDLVAVNGAAYFRYFFASTARVWRVDSATDTVSPLALPTGYEATHAVHLVSASNQVLFVTGSAQMGHQLWRSDGSADLPTLLLQVDTSEGSITDLRSTGSRAVFAVQDAATMTKALWTSDGTPAGTQQLGSAIEDFIVGVHESLPLGMSGDDPVLFATGAEGEVWGTDGTPTGTGRLFTLGANEAVTITTHAGDRAYMATSAGRLVSASLSTQTTEVLSTSVPSNDTALGLAPFGLWLVQQSAFGIEPFVSDGTAAGTRLLRNIADETVTGDSSPAEFIEFNGAFYFSANDGVVGRELWRSDGTSAGTGLFADLVNGPEASHPVAPFVAGGRLYFFTLAGARTLWSTDGSSPPVMVGPAGAQLAPWRTHPIFTLGRSFRCPQSRAAALGGQFYFPAYTFLTGVELWKTDGTAAGTSLAIDLTPMGQSDSSPCTVVAFNNRLFFTAVDSQGARKLWSSDGTSGGTQAIATLSATARPTELFGPVVFGNALYFTTPSEGGVASRLWRSDGSVGSATLVHEAASDAGISVPVVIGNRLVFTAYPPAGSPIVEGELWGTDGTAAGTRVLAGRVAPGEGAVLAAGSQLFFTNVDDATGAEPWRTDGTVSGTRIVQDIAAGAANSSPLWFGNFQGLGLFLVPDQNGNAMMWRTDGTAAETRSIAQFDALRFGGQFFPVESPSPYLAVLSSQFGLELASPVVAGRHMFFLGRDSGGGIELFALESDQPSPPGPPAAPAPPAPPATSQHSRRGGGAIDMPFLALLLFGIVRACFRHRHRGHGRTR